MASKAVGAAEPSAGVVDLGTLGRESPRVKLRPNLRTRAVRPGFARDFGARVFCSRQSKLATIRHRGMSFTNLTGGV